MVQTARFRILKRLALVLFLGFVAIQFIRPSLGNRPATSEIQVPNDVKEILKRSCYDCHSTESKLAWFDLPSPAYWLVVHDIREARTHINFSEIGKLPIGQQRAALYEGLFQVQNGAMPLPAYQHLHKGTTLTPGQLAVLKNYLAQPTEVVPTSEAEIASADSEFAKWAVHGNEPATNVQPEPNGLTFPADYKNWIPISSTDRFDNHTIRQILANDVALRAIANHQIDPWPDGASFAKVAWQQQADAKGIIHPGRFYQVELMRKDSKNHARTLGWAWSRWRGTDLRPYGADAHFDKECVGCHRPLKNTDYLFTAPIQSALTPTSAAFASDALPANPLSWRLITSEINSPGKTIATLYGNDPAANCARANAMQNCPAGSILAFVTWTQKPDEQWFGANIPYMPDSIEFVSVKTGPAGKLKRIYERFEGSPIKPVSVSEALSSDRTSYLLTLRPAVLP